jgi:glycosyltransferase involved in cell wall biosynthesis
MPFSQRNKLSVIIPARNEESTICDVIEACRCLHPEEIIVVANGCSDATASVARSMGCIVVETALALGNDVGRAIGAAKSTGDILLFVDADFPLAPKDLMPFITPLRQGAADVVYNDMDPLFHVKKTPHSVTVWRRAFHVLLGRTDLNLDSLLTVPHAMTRDVLSEIGCLCLANPIWAHWKICEKKYRIAHQFGVNVLKANRFRPEEHTVHPERLSNSEQRIIGDHLAALAAARLPWRGTFSDGGRRRDFVKELVAGKRGLSIPFAGWNALPGGTQAYGGKKLSVIIPVQNEEATITQVVREVRKIEPEEIIVVVNGSTDNSAALAGREGAQVIRLHEPLGNDVGRAVGAWNAKGDILLFIDGDFVIPAEQLYPYVRAVAEGVDVALNDLNHYLFLRYPLNDVTMLKYALNLALNRKDLGIGSMIAVPHAISRRALTYMGIEALSSPAMAQARAVLARLSLENVRRTDVDVLNRIRPEQHFSVVGLPRAVERIIGDHLEAVQELLRMRGPRGLFPVDGRNWNSIQGIR